MRRLVARERGATSIEYALLAAGIALAIIGGVALIGPILVGIFEDVSAGFN